MQFGFPGVEGIVGDKNGTKMLCFIIGCHFWEVHIEFLAEQHCQSPNNFHIFPFAVFLPFFHIIFKFNFNSFRFF